jgi:tRNA (guanine-N7-)-methyltransferase
MPATHLRKVRSFVRRPGRTTTGQRRALAELLPRYGIAFEDRRLDLEAVFGRDRPRVLDIGFGDGEALLGAAANHPDIDYVGVEVYDAGVGHLLMLLSRAGIGNVRVIHHDVVDVLDRMLPPRCFDAVNLFFPDPWPKKRHHKRRLVQPRFVDRLARVLRPGGLFHLATDSPSYAAHAEAVLAGSPCFRPWRPEGPVLDPLAARPPTKFERRGERLGHEVKDTYYRRTDA